MVRRGGGATGGGVVVGIGVGGAGVGGGRRRRGGVVLVVLLVDRLVRHAPPRVTADGRQFRRRMVEPFGGAGVGQRFAGVARHVRLALALVGAERFGQFLALHTRPVLISSIETNSTIRFSIWNMGPFSFGLDRRLTDLLS